MISYRQADLMDRLGPTTLRVDLGLYAGAIKLEYIAPANGRYDEKVWERIKYIKPILIKIFHDMMINRGLGDKWGPGDSLITSRVESAMRELRKLSRVLSAKEITPNFSSFQVVIE